MKTLRRVDPFSVFKVMLLLYLFLGIIFAVLMTPVMVFIAATSHAAGAPSFTPLLTLPFLIAMPVVYAVIGGLTGLIGAALYNLVAGWVGGIKFELEPGS